MTTLTIGIPNPRWKLKGCPRCNGDFFVDKDSGEGTFEQCLQCGYHHYLDEGKIPVRVRVLMMPRRN